MNRLMLIAVIGGQRIAFDAAAIESVVDIWHIVPAPLAPYHIIGLSSVRSRVVTVVDAAACVGLRATATGNRAILFEDDGDAYALRVDTILDVATVTTAVMDGTPAQLGNWVGTADGIVDADGGFAIIVDPVRLVAGATAFAAAA